VDRCSRLALGLARTVADVRDVLLKRGWLHLEAWLDFTSSPVFLVQNKGSTLAKIQHNPDDMRYTATPTPVWLKDAKRDVVRPLLQVRRQRCTTTYYYVLLRT
jgi:hypothetical protein